jgi:hypothetical protein
MAVTLYRSSDSSAPTLTGEVGSLVNVLDKCLVAGYGAKTAAGWTKPFTGTNKAVFRPGAGLQYYLRVQDDAPGAGGAKEARVRGFETMSDVDNGTNLFPTSAQQTNGLFVRKSNTADAVTRAWIVLADARTFYMFALTADVANTYFAWSFGEFYSLKTNDLGRMYIIARSSENSALGNAELLDLQIATPATTTGGHYLARDHQGSVGALAFGKFGYKSLDTGAGSPTPFAGLIGFSNAPDNKIYIGQVRITTPTGGNYIRGRMRGFWGWCHPVSAISDGDTFDGSGDNAGKTFMLIKNTGNAGVYTIETSDTWEVN